MAVWTPGHYSIDDFPKNVLDVKAKTESSAGTGGEASVTKESKNLWRVDWAGSIDSLEANYSVYAFEYHDTKSYVDTVHAIINGGSVFIYPAGMEGSPVSLRLVPYAGWKKVATGLQQSAAWEFLAPDIDVLIDSPIEAGNQDLRSFQVRGIEHQVSLFGDAPVDRVKLVDDLKRIVESEVSIFEKVPYARYVFIVNFTDETGGGLEHLNSTVCFVPRLRTVPSEEYNQMLGLFSHEFLHTWNVKRLKPQGLGPFNYASETYTKSLWIAEGITSYYDDLVLRRAGISTVPEYLEAFVANINAMKSLPGSKWQSAEESSFDTWIKFYRADANSPNVTMSYYTQGAVIGWMLDLQIKKNTKCRLSLDDAMRRIYEETYTKGRRGYTDDEFEATVVSVGGLEGVSEIFDSRVRGRKEVDFDRYFGYAGLRLEPKEGAEKVKGFLGVRIGNEVGRTVVKTRLAGSPAEAIGLSVNDEIIAADGFRVGAEKLSFYVSNRRPGVRINLAVARNGMMMELAGELGRKPPFEYKAVPLAEATDEQRLIFRSWLKEEWRSEIKFPEYAKSPDRRSALDFV
jgi:predicted metalloprotease with PDZ domain